MKYEKYENMNMKWIKQGYDAKLYLRSVLNILKLMGGFHMFKV
jgi:hypothetical protein